MIIDRKNKFACLAIPRTGSMALSARLHEWFSTSVRAGHHRMDVPPCYKEFFIFTVVRNPYSRILSYYRHRRRTELVVRGWNFAAYVHATVRQELHKVGLNNDQRCVDYPLPRYKCAMFKVEDMDLWWPTMPIWDERGAPPVPRGNESLAEYGGEFTEELANTVYAYFRPDFDRFGYDKESWRTIRVSHEG